MYNTTCIVVLFYLISCLGCFAALFYKTIRTNFISFTFILIVTDSVTPSYLLLCTQKTVFFFGLVYGSVNVYLWRLN